MKVQTHTMNLCASSLYQVVFNFAGKSQIPTRVQADVFIGLA